MVNWPLVRRDGRRGLPTGLQVQIGVGILLQQTDEDLGHDAATDRAQPLRPLPTISASLRM